MWFRNYYWRCRYSRNRKRHKLLKFCLFMLLPIGLLLLLYEIHLQLSMWDPYFGTITKRGLGEMGNPASVNMQRAQVEAFHLMWMNYGYNAWLAQRISLTRRLPDVREKSCLAYDYNNQYGEMTPVAIIIVYRNELLATLLRTLHSIYQNTKAELIEELIIVDDNSDMDNLEALAFDSYVSDNIDPRARIFHLPEPVGLLRARSFAADESNAQVLVFLDAHVEVTMGWLEPLLGAITADHHTVSVPMLDHLDEQTLGYRRVAERRTMFDWSLRLRQVPLTPQQLKALPLPYETPIMPGVVFAVDASWFEYLMHYDEEMRGSFGGDLELSFKVWRCGGRILQVPCSRVGHLHRNDMGYRRRYGNVGDFGALRFQNYKRIIEVWLDNYKLVAYSYQPQFHIAVEGDLSLVRGLRNYWRCEDFDWYLKRVAPDLLQHFPIVPRIDYAQGTLRPAIDPELCLTAFLKLSGALMLPCNRNKAQNWTLTYMHDLRSGEQICLELQEYGASDIMLGINLCHNLGGYQFWRYEIHTQSLMSSHRCLEFNHDDGSLLMVYCNPKRLQQHWIFQNINMTAFKNFNL